MKNKFVICFVILETLLIGKACNDINENNCLLSSILTEPLISNPIALSTNSTITLTGVANIQNNDNGNLQIQSNLNITKITTTNCPSLENSGSLSTTEFLNRLTAPCRYDRMELPPVPDSNQPVEVTARAYIFVFDNVASSHFQFNMQALLQLRYVDPRLAFESFAPERTNPIKGEAALRDQIWKPHLFFVNEQESSVLGTMEKDILTSISPNGTVILSTRISATIFCWSELIRFPFDEQLCETTLESWMYNASDVILKWEKISPLQFKPDMQSLEYTIEGYWQNASFASSQDNGIWHGGLIGNYSSLTFTLHLVHSAGYYIMDFFVPSLIMVAVSWVSFWIRADQTPARTIMCCTTMLSLITLGCSQLKTSSSFITIFEIWFLVCVIFIFAALAEFAFSNTIFRRKKVVQLKKVNSKHILKSTVVPNKVKKTKQCHNNSSSSATLDCISFSTEPSVVMTNCSTLEQNDLPTEPSRVSFAISFGSTSTLNMNEPQSPAPPPVPEKTFATMTGQEISIWLDRRARFIFPLLFLIFNVFFWLFVMLV